MRRHRSWLVCLLLASVPSWAAEKPPACPKGALLQTDTHFGGSLHRCMRVDASGKKVQHGPFAELNEHGVVRRRGEYTDGKPSGMWTHYYPSGKRQSEGRLDGTVRLGVWTEWFEDGRVMYTQEYEQGRLVRYNGRLVPASGPGSEDTQAFHLQRAPQVAIVRVVEHLADMPQAMDPGTVIFEVMEPLRGKPVGRFGAGVLSLSGSSMEVGMVAIAGLVSEPSEARDSLLRPVKLDGYVTSVIPYPSVEEARKRARTLLESRPTP